MQKIFVFPGQGSQSVGMGYDLYTKYDIAKRVFSEVDNQLGKKLSQLMFHGSAQELNLTENTQPALMAHSIALLRVLEDITGKKLQQLCSFVAGHSVGEYTALCGASSISLAQASELLQHRGKFMQQECDHQDGAMAACMNIKIDQLSMFIEDLSKQGVCVVANYNSDNQIVISGERMLIEQAIAIVKDCGGRAIMLSVNGAFHSSMMQKAQDKMLSKLEVAEFFQPLVPIVMNVSAASTEQSCEIKANLAKQITHSVKWHQIIQWAASNMLEIVEIGTGSTLANLAKRSGYPYLVHSIYDCHSLDAYISSI